MNSRVIRAMISCIILLFAFLVLEGTYIDISTSDVFGYQSLTQYGYVYQPETNCRAQFTFQVKACGEVHVALLQFDEDLAFAYEIVIAGWYNTKWRIYNRARTHHFIDHYVNGSVKCDTYTTIWIEWRNKDIVAGVGDVVRDVIISFTDLAAHQVGFIGISTGYGVSGDWKIPIQMPPSHCYLQWRLLPQLQSTNMAANIANSTWTVTGSNIGQCAVKCRWSSHCVSFVYNTEESTCQGYDQNFNDVTGIQKLAPKTSYYYTTS